MPTLYKPKYNKKTNINKQIRDDIYNSRRWKNLRLLYIKHNPLCEICLAAGKTTLASDVHHKDSFTLYNGEERYNKAYDYYNLMSLCKYHHTQLHKNHHQPNGFDIYQYKKCHEEEFYEKD